MSTLSGLDRGIHSLRACASCMGTTNRGDEGIDRNDGYEANPLGKGKMTGGSVVSNMRPPVSAVGRAGVLRSILEVLYQALPGCNHPITSPITQSPISNRQSITKSPITPSQMIW